MAKQERIAGAAGLPEGEIQGVEIEGQWVLLANVGGRIFAVSDICTHEECNMSDGGTLEDNEVECPCHGSRFDVTTGAVTQAPAVEAVKTFPVAIEGQDVLVTVE